MENEYGNTYEHLIEHNDNFQIEKNFLINLLTDKKIETKDSYKELNKIGGLEGLIDKLEVNLQSGICDEEDDLSRFNHRKKHFGENNPMAPPTRSFIRCLLDVFYDKSIIFLFIVATIRLIIDILYKGNRWFDYCSIYVIVLIIALVVAITNFSRDQVFAKFQMKIDYKEVRVLRNKVEKLIPIQNIVVGDILIVTAGDILPVDGIIFKAYSVSLETKKKVMKFHNIYYHDKKNYYKYSRNNYNSSNDYFPFVLSGSKIIKGYAYLLVLTVGHDTYVNRKFLESMKKHELITKLPDKKDKDLTDQTTTESIATEESKGIKQNPKIQIDNTNEANFSPQIKLNNDSENSTIKRNSTRTKQNKLINISEDNYGELEKEILNTQELDRKKENIIEAATRLSPLQVKIHEISIIISKFGLAASILTTIFIIVTYICFPESFSQNTDAFKLFFDAILYGIVIIVVAVPEGLPLAVTLSLAFSLNKMRDDKTVIKSIEACENMACLDTICTDYRGILTKSELEIISIFIEEQSINDSNVANLKYYASEDLYNFFCESISVNTIAFSVRNKEPGFEKYVGDPIECSLLRYLKNKLHVDYSFIRNNSLRPIIDISPISTNMKCSFTAIEMDEKREYVRLYVKGFPDFLLDLISIYIGSEQNLEQMTQIQYEKIRRKSNNIIRNGNIPLLLCYRDIPKDNYYQTRQAYYNKETEFMANIVRQLTFICLIGMKENLKEGVEQDILDCQNAGIVVRLVTSQSKESARIAAIKCGIIKGMGESSRRNTTSSGNNLRITEEETAKEKQNTHINIPSKTDSLLTPNFKGSIYQIIDTQEDFTKYVEIQNKKKNLLSLKSFDFSILDFYKFNSLIDNARVISNALSKDKFILVSTLKKKGSIVAITGDGVNDSLAMKTAHVGISMGNHSSDISKESADVILLEDDFKSIITGIIYSRNIFDSVRKFLQFQMTATASISILVVISALPFIEFYFYPNQLLWLNLIMDTFGSLSLASQQPNRDQSLKKKTYSIDQNIVTKTMKVKITVQTLIQITIVIILMFMLPFLFNVPSDIGFGWDNSNITYGYHTTFIFTCIVFMQVFNAFISRNIEKDEINIFKNILEHNYFIIIQLWIIILQILIVNYGHDILKTTPLGLNSLLLCAGISSITLLTIPIVRYLPFKDDEYIIKNKERIDVR